MTMADEGSGEALDGSPVEGAGGDADALYDLGVSLEDTDAVGALKALKCFEQAAELGHRTAMRRLGVLLVGQDRMLARRWWERAAGEGDAKAMYNLGRLLGNDEPTLARSWYERAADLGHARSMVNLGVILNDIDPPAALVWFERAADLGNGRAMDNLGYRLKDTDPVRSQQWYERAAETGEVAAMNHLGDLFTDADPVVLSAGGVDEHPTGRGDVAHGRGSPPAPCPRAPSGRPRPSLTAPPPGPAQPEAERRILAEPPLGRRGLGSRRREGPPGEQTGPRSPPHQVGTQIVRHWGAGPALSAAAYAAGSACRQASDADADGSARRLLGTN
jgi:TPR repeat protein